MIRMVGCPECGHQYTASGLSRHMSRINCGIQAYVRAQEEAIRQEGYALIPPELQTWAWRVAPDHVKRLIPGEGRVNLWIRKDFYILVLAISRIGESLTRRVGSMREALRPHWEALRREAFELAPPSIVDALVVAQGVEDTVMLENLFMRYCESRGFERPRGSVATRQYRAVRHKP